MNILSYIYQLPQNIIGLLISTLPNISKKVHTINNINIYLIQNNNTMESMSIGQYIFINPSAQDGIILRHEYGHTLQSKILGPLYIPLIVIPSFIWCYLGNANNLNHYYSFYTESSANKLVGKVKGNDKPYK